jgi:hypothetical protein
MSYEKKINSLLYRYDKAKWHPNFESNFLKSLMPLNFEVIAGCFTDGPVWLGVVLGCM